MLKLRGEAAGAGETGHDMPWVTQRLLAQRGQRDRQPWEPAPRGRIPAGPCAVPSVPRVATALGGHRQTVMLAGGVPSAAHTAVAIARTAFILGKEPVAFGLCMWQGVLILHTLG